MESTRLILLPLLAQGLTCAPPEVDPHRRNLTLGSVQTKNVSGSEKFWGAFWVGGAAKKGDAYDEQIDEVHTKARLNITHGTFNLAGHNTDTQPIRDEEKFGLCGSRRDRIKRLGAVQK